MKRSFLFSLTAILLGGIFFFSSCAQDRGLTIEKRRYGKGFYVHVSGKPETKAEKNTVAEEQSALVQENELPAAEQKTAFNKNNTATQMAESERSAFTVQLHPEKKKPVPVSPAKKATEQKQPVKEKLKKVLKKTPLSQPDGDLDQIIMVILALLIPPLAVYLKEGLSKRFWVDLICYLLGGAFFLTPYFYGGGLLLFAVVFAILIVLDVI